MSKIVQSKNPSRIFTAETQDLLVKILTEANRKDSTQALIEMYKSLAKVLSVTHDYSLLNK